MFKFAESGIVAWPTEFPVDQDGLPTPTKVLVRYKPLTKAELAQIDQQAAKRQAMKLAETLVEASQPAQGDTVEARTEDARRRAQMALEAIDFAIAQSAEREAERAARVQARVVAIQPPGETAFYELAPAELARQLEFEVLLGAYERGLMECSRAAVAKN